jgi:Concanavalin A-like lectin/glucanases superfamily/Domain of unknown function (DUF1929)/Bacterial Ig domain/Kelch motif
MLRLHRWLAAALLTFVATSASAAVAIDASASRDLATKSTTMTTPAFSTAAGNELLLAFISTDYMSGTNTTVTSVTGAGLTWVLVVRTNAQRGTSEIWRAFSPSLLTGVSVTATTSQNVVSSLTVMTFTGADVSGTNGSGAIGAIGSGSGSSGAPAATLVTTRANSLVFGVGNDYDNAIARTPATGQSIVRQYLPSIGDTYWVQKQISPSAISGTSVTIRDTAPTTDRYNLSICEILPALIGGSVSGTISPALGGSGATVVLSGATSATVTADSSGYYSFTGVANGTYTVFPTESGYTFTPGNRSVTVSGFPVTGYDFTALAMTGSISGTISPASLGSGAHVTLGGLAVTTTADSAGNYSFSGLPDGIINVTPTKLGYAFTPSHQSVTIVNGNSLTAVNFAIQATPTWTVSGTISPAGVCGGATVTLTGAATPSTVTADSSGNYTFTGVADFSYFVTPSKSGCTFTPAYRTATVNGADVSGLGFVAQSLTGSISGTISPPSNGAGTTVILGEAQQTIADSNGNYTLNNVPNGAYTVVSYKPGYSFTPTTQSVTVNGAPVSGVNFVAKSTTGSISGTISPASLGSGAQVTLGGMAVTTIADSNGNYSFSGVPNATINVTPTKLGYTFTPSQQAVTVDGAAVSGVNFTIQASPTWTVSGTISPAGVCSGATVTMTGGGTPSTATTDSSGNYSFAGVADFSYFVTPSKSGCTFTPAYQTAAVNGADVPGLNFAAQSFIHDISGTISPASDGVGAMVIVGETAQAIADSNGNYTLKNMWNGTYPLMPTKPGYIFTPSVQWVTVNGAPVTGINFTATSTTSPAAVGQWGAPIELGLVAVNTVMLHTGKVLMYSGSFATSYTERVWDPVTGSLTLVPNPFFNLFCSGHAQLADGRILVVGGYDSATLGAKDANIFDPVTQSWTQLPNMAYRRWYPTATTLPDGRVLVTSGAQTCLTCLADVPEIFDPATGRFTTLPSARLAVPYYPFMFVLPDGKVIDAGANEDPAATSKLDMTTGTWTTVDPIVRDGHSAAMYRLGKILKSGTAADSGTPGNAAATAYVLDTTQPSPAWRQVASMAYPRAFHNTTLLPDGSVLVTGGGTALDGYDTTKAALRAELWSPTTETWQTLSAASIPRLYHSTALLLPDARVLTAGSGNDGPAVNQTQAEIFSPPYLFKGARPTIGSAPDLIQYGAAFSVSTPDAASIASVSLVRPGAVTHSFDEDQRYLSLGFTADSGLLTIQAPANANLAPPGYYMLFLVNNAGVPSIAAFVHFSAPGVDAVPPTAPAGLTGQGAIGSATLSWNASTDNTGVALYNVHRSTTSGFQPSMSNRIAQPTSTSVTNTGVAAGTYFYVVTAQDIAGNVSGPSNEASVTVLPDTIAPTVMMMTPAQLETVSGSISVSAAASDDVGVLGVQFQIDGQPLGIERTTPPYSVIWNTATTSNGSHVLTAVARDAALNSSQATVDVVVSNTSQTPSGLVAAYGFNEGIGVQVTDASGQANTGTISSATWTTTGKFGAALSFNGTSSWVTVADAASLDLTTGMTIEAWVNPAAGTGWRTVVLKENAGGLAYALYAANNASRPAGFVHTSADAGLNGTSAVPLSTWTHLALTFDGTTLRMFVNGVQVSSVAVAGAAVVTSNGLRIGGNSIWGEYFRGLIDEVRIYNRALAASEIQTDMNVPIP